MERDFGWAHEEMWWSQRKSLKIEQDRNFGNWVSERRQVGKWSLHPQSCEITSDGYHMCDWSPRRTHGVKSIWRDNDQRWYKNKQCCQTADLRSSANSTGKEQSYKEAGTEHSQVRAKCVWQRLGASLKGREKTHYTDRSKDEKSHEFYCRNKVISLIT